MVCGRNNQVVEPKHAVGPETRVPAPRPTKVGRVPKRRDLQSTSSQRTPNFECENLALDGPRFGYQMRVSRCTASRKAIVEPKMSTGEA
jgi:hypothetical protein